MAIIYTTAFVHSLVAAFDSAKGRVLAEPTRTHKRQGVVLHSM